MPIDLDGDAGGDRAERIPDGECVAEVSRVYTSKKEGGPLKTKAGDRKIRVIFSDQNGREAMYEAMVEGAAVFKIARLLKHAGYSSDALEEAGIDAYTDFCDQRTAERFLLKKRVRISVTSRVTDGKVYADVETIPQTTADGKEQKPPAKAKPKPEPVAPREDVPF